MVDQRIPVFLLLAAALLGSCARPHRTAVAPATPQIEHDVDEHDDNPFESAEYFRERRVPGDGLLPIERYFEAKRHAGTMRGHALNGAGANLGTWESLGPGNVGGRTRGLVVHPTNPAILWLGGATGGVWKTTNGGQSWAATTDFAPVLTINSLVMDPRDPNTLYAGTGEQTQNWRGAGIFRTSDGGASWSQMGATATPDFYFVNNIAISRNNSAQIYAATNSGLWSTVDGGGTWKLSLASPDGGPAPTLTGGMTNGCFDVTVQPGQARDVVFAVCHPAGSLQYAVFRNADAAGQGTWTQVLADPNMWYTTLAVAPSQTSTIYAIAVTYDSASAYAKGLLAVYRSTANGDAGSWSVRTSNTDTNRLNTAILSVDSAYNFTSGFCNSSAPNLNGQGGYNLALTVDPLDANRVWAAGLGVFRSDDGGANWGFAFNGDHPDQHGLVFDPGFDGGANQTLYNVNDGGIFKTTQARGKTGTCASTGSAVNWTALNNSYVVTQFYHGVAYPGGGSYFGGTQDNGTVRGADAAGPNQWNSIFGGDGGVSRVDPVNISTLFAETPHGALVRSLDGGISYQNAVNGLNETSLNFPFVAQYVFDPNNSLRLYLGGTQLWRSENSAASWQAASAPASQPGGVLDNIRSLAVSPADPNLVVFGMNHGRIFRNSNTLAANASTAWDSTQPRAGNVSDLAFDGRLPSTIYATYTTFNSSPGDNHIYRSGDAGISWTGIDGTGASGLPDVPVETLLVDPDDSSRLYVGSDLGVFASFDGGATWERDANPFADAITTRLSVEHVGGVKYLYAFTYGRGVWRTPLGGVAAAVCAYGLSPSPVAAPVNGGTLTVDVTTSTNCGWAAVPVTGNFAAVQGPGYGTGNGTLFLTAPANHSTAARSMTLRVQNQTVTVSQAGLVNAPLGDEISRALKVASLPFEGASSNAALTQNTNDPRHSCTGSGDFRTGWLQFTAAASGTLQAAVQAIRSDTGAGNSGVAIAAYPLNGAAIGEELACASVAKDSSGPLKDAVIRFPVVAGAVYVVETASLATGAASDNAQMYVGIGAATPVPTFDVSPPEAIVNPGQSRRMQAVVSGVPNPAVRWTVSPPVGVIAPDGTYTAPQNGAATTVTITAQSLASTALSSTATIALQTVTGVSLAAPAVTNAASFQTGAVAPGEVVTIFGAGIGPANTVTAQLNSQGRVASLLSGTQVLFDNIPAPLVYVTASQVSAIVPYEVAGQATTQMVVVRNGQGSAPVNLQVTATAPALFTSASSGTGQAAAINQDSTLNGAQSAAPAGSIVALFATGEGQTAPGGINGRVATPVAPQPLAGVSVKIGGVDAEVEYAGAAPQAVAGLLQVNVKIPQGLPSGPNAVVLTIGGVQSAAGVTIAVR